MRATNLVFFVGIGLVERLSRSSVKSFNLNLEFRYNQNFQKWYNRNLQLGCSSSNASRTTMMFCSKPLVRRDVLLGGGFLVSSMFTDESFAATASDINVSSIDDNVEGLAAVTQSELGKSFRYGTVKGAKVMDQIDLTWERFSDRLRDKNKCDPVTNRRLFDNGKRRDGTSIGNPVLGALCNPVPLEPFNDELGRRLLSIIDQSALKEMSLSEDLLKVAKNNIQALVKPSFDRAQKGIAETSSNDEDDGSSRKRTSFNYDLYIQTRAISMLLQQSYSTSTSKSELRNRAKNLEIAIGQNLRKALASESANRKDYRTPLPLQLPDLEKEGVLNYDSGTMLDALGVLSASLTTLQKGGMIGQWEIIVPDANDGEVVTIAIDDDITIPTQVLLREQGMILGGSLIIALARALMNDAGITYNVDSYFIDPTTTQQEKYNPTQLLINLRDLGA